MPTDEIQIFDTQSNFVTSLGNTAWLKLEYGRAVNAVGSLTLTLPPDFPLRYLRRDNQIAIMRRVGTGQPYLEGGTRWFITRLSQILNSGGDSQIVVGAVDAVDLLSRRIVNAAAGAANANMTSAADTMLTTIVTNELATAGSRRFPLFGVQTATGLCPSITKAFSHRNVLIVLQEIAQASLTNGTYLAFDVLWNGNAFQFQTYPYQRGVDRRWPLSVSPIILSPESGSLASVTYTTDYSTEITYTYAGGGLTGADRVMYTAQDTARSGLSPWGVIEQFVNASMAGTDTTAIQKEADAALRAGRPRITFQAEASETPTLAFGRDYRFGDLVTAQAFGQSVDCRLDAYRVSADGGKDRVNVVLRSVT